MDDFENLELNEISVLGNILLDNDGYQMLTAVQYLVPEDFTDPKNRYIYSAMLEINSKGQTPDIATVVTSLKNNKTFDAAGGAEYIDTITKKTARIASIDVYIQNIKDKALLSRVAGKAKQIYDATQTSAIPDISSFIAKAAEEMNELAKQRTIKDALSLGEVAPALVNIWNQESKDARDKGIKRNGIVGISTGYQSLDYLTKGFKKQNMIIIGARPSVGKTAFCLNLLYNVARKEGPVIFFSLEMSATSILSRLLTLTTNLSSDEINALDFMPDSKSEKLKVNTNGNPDIASKVDSLQHGLNTLSKLPFYIDENPGTNVNDIAAKCRKLIKGQNIQAKLIAIDYLGLIGTTSKSDNRANQVAEITRAIKLLAKELNVPIIVLSQLSRDSAKRGADHKGQLTDLRDSGAIEQDADLVFFLNRPDYYNDNGDEKKQDDIPDEDQESKNISEVELSLKKNRDGALGDIHFIFDKVHCQFNEKAEDRQQDF